METCIRELESEMDAENRRWEELWMDLDLDDGNVAMWHYNRCTDAIKNLRKSERHVKELQFQQDEVQLSNLS